MHSETQKLSVREKIGYGLGDGAANFVFQTLMLLQASFYTDTFGLSAGTAAVLFLVARIWGAVADPIMGAIADRTNTRWGKFRPWIIITALPFGVIAYLAFTTPEHMAIGGKLMYAYVTYLLLMTIYSANNIPYSALGGVITGNMEQRTSLSSFRFVIVTIATLAIQGLVLPMVNHFGQGDSAKGYQMTMAIFGALAVLFFIVTFTTTRERIKPAPQQKTSLLQDITDLVMNRQWVIMFAVFLFMFIFLAIRNQILVYFFKYYLAVESQVSFLQGIDKVLFGLLGTMGMTGANADIAGNTFSIMNIFNQLISLVGIAFSLPLAKKLGKRDAFRTWLIIAGISAALFFIVPPSGIWLTFILSLLFNFSWGVTMPLPWAMMADVTDYGEWKNNRRATGISFAGIIFGLKLGLAIGGFIGLQILDAYGYIANVVQTPKAIMGIRLTLSLYPVLALFFVVIALFIYAINRKTEYQMQDELAERRKAYVK
jgi:glycoside/pentoside/hexuronide:cation symporter, GPH family